MDAGLTYKYDCKLTVSRPRGQTGWRHTDHEGEAPDMSRPRTASVALPLLEIHHASRLCIQTCSLGVVPPHDGTRRELLTGERWLPRTPAHDNRQMTSFPGFDIWSFRLFDVTTCVLCPLWTASWRPLDSRPLESNVHSPIVTGA